MATWLASSRCRGENGRWPLSEVEHLGQRKDEKKKIAWNECLQPNGGQASNFPSKSITSNSTLSLSPVPNTGFRHSTSSTIYRTFEQDETGDSPPRRTWAGDAHAVKSFHMDLKPNPKAMGFHSSPQMKHSRSFVEHRKGPKIDNFCKWMEDNLNFSKQIEVLLKKKGLWKWKPLRALAHIRRQRFRCIFSLHVQCVEGLPQSMNDLLVSVHWSRRDKEEQTMPVRVCEGTATVEETLYQSCTIYATKSPGQVMYYKPKVSTLFVTVVGADGLDLGRHRLDISWMLPKHLPVNRKMTKPQSWTMRFNLIGNAKEGTLTVTFSYKIPYKELQQMWETDTTYADIPTRHSNQSFGRYSDSTPGTTPACAFARNVSPYLSGYGSDSDDIPHISLDDQATRVNEISTKLSRYVQKSKDIKRSSSLASLFALESKINFSNSFHHVRESSSSFSQAVSQDRKEVVSLDDDIEFTVVEKGVEISGVNILQFPEPDRRLLFDSSRSIEEEESNWSDMNVQQNWQSGTPSPYSEENADFNVLFGRHQQERDSDLGKAYTRIEELLVEGQFLNMLDQEYNSLYLSSESDADSSTTCHLEDFEKESSLEESSLGPKHYEPVVLCSTQPSQVSWDLDEDSYLASIVQAAESEFQKATQTRCSKIRAEIVENAEAEALMKKWGLDEKAFQNSPPKNLRAFGSPIDFHSPDYVERPALAKGLGSVVRLRDGGCLRSMSPMLFDCSKYKGSLLMQVARPLVVPANTSSSAVDILCSLASVGAETLAIQATTTMPLEDITGKSIQQLVLEAGPGLNTSKIRQITYPGLNKESDHRSDEPSIDKWVAVSQGMKQTNFRTPELNMSPTVDTFDEFVSLEELVPSAMDKIEPLVIEGLKIQSDMSEQNVPSNLNALQSAESIPSEQRRMEKSLTQGLEGISSLGLSDTKNCDHNDDGLMAMAITLDEWVQLDSEMTNKKANERTSKILLDHHESHLQLIRRRHLECSEGEINRKKHALERWGFIGNNLTIALRVQLHDPLRSYEPVGAPMMALVKAERIELPSNSKRGRRVPDRWNCEVLEETKDRKEETSQFKVTDVHVAGLKLQEDTRTKSWTNPRQQQSGSRWLIANGMAKTQKHGLQKLKQQTPSKVKVKPGDTLWSISARFHGNGNKWNEIVALNPHIRNPDIILPNETIILR